MTLLPKHNYYKNTLPKTRLAGTILGIFLLVGSTLSYALSASAAVTDWQKGVSLYPEANNDFSTVTFQQSLTNAAAIHANMATFIVPYYQLNENTSDIQIGWNTPTDASLIAGITYAHSLGMRAAIKIHLSPYYGNGWEADIDPTDRAGWFAAYGNILLHYATLAQENSVEQLVMGNELTQMTTYTSNPDNTAEWEKMIPAVRALYHGSLTYNANWGGDYSSDEKDHIGFWQDLDIVGISAYFNLRNDRLASWSQWNASDIAPFYQKYGKPIVFTEIGYRSVDDAYAEPWNYTLGNGQANTREQADDYTALFQYWNNYSYMQGFNLWNWDTNPNAGGPNNANYTVQNKPAQTIVSNWFGEAK